MVLSQEQNISRAGRKTKAQELEENMALFLRVMSLSVDEKLYILRKRLDEIEQQVSVLEKADGEQRR